MLEPSFVKFFSWCILSLHQTFGMKFLDLDLCLNGCLEGHFFHHCLLSVCAWIGESTRSFQWSAFRGTFAVYNSHILVACGDQFLFEQTEKYCRAGCFEELDFFSLTGGFGDELCS
jgi:hypothetical protein